MRTLTDWGAAAQPDSPNFDISGASVLRKGAAPVHDPGPIRASLHVRDPVETETRLPPLGGSRVSAGRIDYLRASRQALAEAIADLRLVRLDVVEPVEREWRDIRWPHTT